MSKPAEPEAGLVDQLRAVELPEDLGPDVSAQISGLDHVETVLEIGSAVADTARRSRQRSWVCDVEGRHGRATATAVTHRPPTNLVASAAALAGVKDRAPTRIEDDGGPGSRPVSEPHPGEWAESNGPDEHLVTLGLNDLADQLAALQKSTGLLIHGTVGHTRDDVARRELAGGNGPRLGRAGASTSFWHVSVIAESPGDLETALTWNAWPSEPTLPAQLLWYLERARAWPTLPVARVPSGPLDVLFGPAAVHSLLTPVVSSLSGANVAAGRSFLTDVGSRVAGHDVDLLELAGLPGHGAPSGEPGAGSVGVESEDLTSDEPLPVPAVDDEGIECRQLTLLGGGRSAQRFHTLATAAQCRDSPTGNAFRGTVVHRRPEQTIAPAVNDVVLETAAGRRAHTSELIGSMRSGLLVESLQGETQRGEFSPIVRGRIRLGFLVNRGEVVGRLRNQAVTIDVRDVLGDQLAGASSQRWPVSRGWSARLPFVLTQPK